MDASLLREGPWERALSLLGDLESSSREWGAVRRRRAFARSSDLLRALLAYACGSLSLRSVAAWSGAAGLGSLSAVALFRRLAASEAWLAALLTRVASLPADPAGAGPAGLRALVADATVVCGPRARGTEWRVHALYDPSAGRLAHLEVTDERGGEGLWRFPLGPGDLAVADACYGTARSYRWAVSRGAHALLRATPTNLRTLDERGARFDLAGWAQGAGPEPESAWLWLPEAREGPATRVRMVRFLSPKGTPVCLMTSLNEEQASDRELVDLYRLRWQAELLFKRWKGLAGLGRLPRAHHGPTARAWVLARLLLVSLAEALGPLPGGGRGAASGGGSSAACGRRGSRCSRAASPA